MLIERERTERQNQQLSDFEAEINLTRRRLELLEGDRVKDKNQIKQLQDALNRARVVGQCRIIVGRGGALVETMTLNRRVVGSTPALAAT